MKKKETVICTNVDLEGIALSEMSLTKKRKKLLCEIFIKVKYREAESRTVAIRGR